MMPFSIRSGLLLTNKSTSEAQIELESEALETNSTRRGGHEFVSALNSRKSGDRISLAAGERILLGHTHSKRIPSGHFFAGVLDFKIIAGELSLDEVVFKNSPADVLRPSEYSQRTHWGVHESLVYKGIAKESAVVLRGANFTIDASTPAGPLPLRYSAGQIKSETQSQGTCDTRQVPVCQGSALEKETQPSEHTSWVTHIAPDPRDSNPKRKRAILDDLISLVLPASSAECGFQWPRTKEDDSKCKIMSPFFFWYHDDFQAWRLPNWGNWGVHYTHPVSITNHGHTERTVVLKVTADGASPVAFRGTGVSTAWQQAFLNPRSRAADGGTLVIAKKRLPPAETVELTGEFILSGPGAGTLEHSVEIIE
ncbi:MAG: hypothetical protein RIR26_1702 [Pseudomonadota bacterium]